eukprot:2622603-Rhodomonas_salina.1
MQRSYKTQADGRGQAGSCRVGCLPWGTDFAGAILRELRLLDCRQFVCGTVTSQCWCVSRTWIRSEGTRGGG